MLSASYPFLDVIWTILIFFLWVAWFWMLFAVWGDVFRRDDLSGWGKTGWLVLTLLVPFLGVFIYLLMEHDGMAERNIKTMQAQQAVVDEHIRTVATSTGPAHEIDTAVRGHLESALKRALDILRASRAVLDEGAAALLAHETLTGDEIPRPRARAVA